MAGIALLFSCNSSKEAASSSPDAAATQVTLSAPSHPFVKARRPIVVYRTKADYSQLVPVILNEARTQLTSYPDPVDVGTHSVPVQLDKGYLYDQRGIGPNVAYTSYTYAAYAQLKQVPAHEALLQSIVEKNPLLEMWNCTDAYYALEAKQGKAKTAEAQIALLNQLIASGFEGCKPLLEVEEE